MQLHDLEMGILESINYDMDIEWWIEMDEPDPTYLKNVNDGIASTFERLRKIYVDSADVTTLLTQSLILIQNCAWTALNIPFPNYINGYIVAIKTNLIRVFERQMYKPLQKAMMMANHHCEIIQRVWRHCNSNPTHPVCRRRLYREFEELSSDLNNRCV